MEENLFGRESKPADKDKTKMISCRRDGRRSKKTDLSRRRDVFLVRRLAGLDRRASPAERMPSQILLIMQSSLCEGLTLSFCLLPNRVSKVRCRLRLPLQVKDSFAFRSEFPSVRSVWKCLRSKLFPCGLFKIQIPILPSVVIELADNFDLGGSQRGTLREFCLSSRWRECTTRCHVAFCLGLRQVGEF